MNSKSLVVIPTFNCKKQILELLKDIEEYLIPEDTFIWIIDNLSNDGTYEAATKFIHDNEMKSISTFRAMENNSLGGTHKIGFNEALKNSWEYLAIFHGDNQGYYPDLIKFLKLAKLKGSGKSYLGTRFSRESNLFGYSRKRIIGNVVLNTFYSICKMRKISDLGSGLNLYYVKDLKRINYLDFGDSLTFNFELLLAMIDEDISFEYVAISWRETDQISNAKNIRIFISGLRILFQNMLRLNKRNVKNNRIYAVRS